MMKEVVEYNEPRQTVIDSEVRGHSVKVTIVSIQNGTCHNGLAASLIVLEVRHGDSIGNARIRKTRMGIESSPVKSTSLENDSATACPEVEHFCPAILDGPPSVTQVWRRAETSLTLGIQTLVFSNFFHGSKANTSRESKWDVTHCSVLEGQRSKSKQKRDESDSVWNQVEYNAVEWTFHEDSISKSSVPPLFKAAVLLKNAGYGSQFKLQIALDVSIQSEGMLKMSWTSHLGPVFVVFRSTRQDESSELVNFDEFGEDCWKNLVEFDHVYSVGEIYLFVIFKAVLK